MTDLFTMLQDFHFLRPWWLALIPAALLLWWRVRSRTTARPDPPTGLAPHLADALTVGRGGRSRLLAIDGVSTTLVLVALAAAGPTWSRVPNPLVAQTAPLAIAFAISESMLTQDVAPSRLERAKQKLLDLSAARAGGRTALIAYAGSAHRVVPLTEDPEVLEPFIEGLEPNVMPQPGRNATAALELARAALASDATPGAILFVLDELDRSDHPAFERHAAEHGAPVIFLSLGGSRAALAELARVPGSHVLRATPDGSDVREIERRVANRYREALSQDDRQQWDDRGWMLTWPAALLALLWFRRGWTLQSGLALFALALALPSGSARADGIAEWLLTPDQQGRLAFESGELAEAAEIFEDPRWKGYALYSVGDYSQAAQTFARVASAEAAFAEGMAHVKGRAYRQGIDAFEKALGRKPDFAVAARNLEIARAILAYLEEAREQTDTGDGSEGADEIVFDKESKGGFEMVAAGEQQVAIEAAQQWMRSVDTRTSDFLRIRFALEAARAEP